MHLTQMPRMRWMPRALTVGTAVLLSTTLVACGGSKSDHSATSSSSSSATSATSSKATTAPKKKLSPRALNPSGQPGTEPTIADYIAAQHITETPIHPGDPGSPQIDLPVPDGWELAGDDTPDYAWGAIVYTAAAAEYTPNIVALVSKLDGDVDPDRLLSLAGGELKNLPGFELAGEESGTVSGFPCYRIAGKYNLQGIKAASGQETVVINGGDGLYVMQLNATSDEGQSDQLFDALGAIDDGMKITP